MCSSIAKIMSPGVVAVLFFLFPGEARSERGQLDPLVRVDPNINRPANLVRILGDSTQGLPAACTGVAGRVGETDTWFVGLGGAMGLPSSVALMKLDREEGILRFREMMRLKEVADVSSTAGLLVGCREDSKARKSWICFSIHDSKALWKLAEEIVVMDAIFTADGKQLVVLHGVGNVGYVMDCAVSWYDSADGRLLRRVSIPDRGNPGGCHFNRSQLAAARDGLYVALVADVSGETGAFYRISAESEIPERLDFPGFHCGGDPKIEVGGTNRELIAFYDYWNVHVARVENDRIRILGNVSLDFPRDELAYRTNVHFSPSGELMVVANCLSSVVLPIDGKRIGEPVKTLDEGGVGGGFTADGAYYIWIDDGGGRVVNTKSWRSEHSLREREQPAHGGPITSVAISTDGRFIASCDRERLLFWSREGQLLAQLISDRDGSGIPLWMQSPVILESDRKVLAGDGWHFLEWSLDEIERRVRNRPVNVPRVKGKVVFDDNRVVWHEPELMNLVLSPKGDKLLTATRAVVMFRSSGAWEDPTALRVPDREIFMRPRSFKIHDDPLRIFLESGANLFELHSGGVTPETVLHRSGGAVDAAGGRMFVCESTKSGDAELRILPLADAARLSEHPKDEIRIPIDRKGVWPHSSFLVAGKAGVLISTTLAGTGGDNVLVATDFRTGKIVWTVETIWKPTSLSISSDEKLLVVGASDKAVYVFDLSVLQPEGE